MVNLLPLFQGLTTDYYSSQSLQGEKSWREIVTPHALNGAHRHVARLVRQQNMIVPMRGKRLCCPRRYVNSRSMSPRSFSRRGRKVEVQSM